MADKKTKQGIDINSLINSMVPSQVAGQSAQITPETKQQVAQGFQSAVDTVGNAPFVALPAINSPSNRQVGEQLVSNVKNSLKETAELYGPPKEGETKEAYLKRSSGAFVAGVGLGAAKAGKAGKTIGEMQQAHQIPDLTKYEKAFNSKDVQTLDSLAKKYPEDARFNVHKRFAEKTDLPPIPKKSVVRIALRPSVYGAGREKAVQDTVDRFVPGKTATEQYSNLESTMNDFGERILATMQAKPKSATLDQIMKDYDTNLNKEGIYRTTKLTKDAVQKEARTYVEKLYRSAKGVPDNIAPTEITDFDLYSLKQAVNQDTKSIFKKIDNGTTLTDEDKVILAARQTIDDALSSLHKDVKDLTTKQSHLYDAEDSLFKAREAEVNTPNPGLLGKLKQHPVGAAIIGGATTLGLTRLPDIAGAAKGLYDSAVSNIENATKQPLEQSKNSTNEVKYNVTTPLDDGTLISEQAQAKRQGELQRQIGEAELNNPVLAAQLKGQLASNETEFVAQGNLRKLSTDTQSVIQSANNASNDLKNVDPAFILALTKGYDYFQKANGGAYSTLATDLKALEKFSGVDLTTAKSKEALQAAIDAIVKIQGVKLQSAQTQYSGSVNAPAPTQSPPSLPPIPQAAVDWSGNDPRVNAVLNSSGSLPPI